MLIGKDYCDKDTGFVLLDSPYGYYMSALDYWMPIELPKEDVEDGKVEKENL